MGTVYSTLDATPACAQNVTLQRYMQGHGHGLGLL